MEGRLTMRIYPPAADLQSGVPASRVVTLSRSSRHEPGHNLTRWPIIHDRGQHMVDGRISY